MSSLCFDLNVISYVLHEFIYTDLIIHVQQVYILKKKLSAPKNFQKFLQTLLL